MPACDEAFAVPCRGIAARRFQACEATLQRMRAVRNGFAARVATMPVATQKICVEFYGRVFQWLKSASAHESRARLKTTENICQRF